MVYGLAFLFAHGLGVDGIISLVYGFRKERAWPSGTALGGIVLGSKACEILDNRESCCVEEKEGGKGKTLGGYVKGGGCKWRGNVIYPYERRRNCGSWQLPGWA